MISGIPVLAVPELQYTSFPATLIKSFGMYVYILILAHLNEVALAFAHPGPTSEPNLPVSKTTWNSFNFCLTA